MKCQFCGNDLLDGESSCRYCGNQVLNNTMGEEDWLKVYAGKNSLKVLYKKWSWPAFFFGPVYFLYRKMWGIGFLGIILFILLSLLISNTILLFIIQFIIYIFLSANFSSLYYEQARYDVNEILKKHTSKEEIFLELEKKGGTSTGVSVIFGLIYFVDFAFRFLFPLLFLLWLF